MADIAPLRGIIYNQDNVGDMGYVTAPPYDVVNRRQQAQYHASHPNNVLRIDLGAGESGDKDEYDWHLRAAYDFNRWMSEGVLIRHDEPAIYYTETDFTDPTTGQRLTRHGFVCLLRLEEFGAEAKVRPHERTFSAHKAERLNHMINVQANLSQVFSVFPDEKQEARAVLNQSRSNDPLFDFTDDRGQGHRMWVIRDREAIGALGRIMHDKTIYIADGHHRYETALNYRRLKAESGVHIGKNSPLNYLMVYLCGISDPGLAILPAHRLISKTLKYSLEELDQLLPDYFKVQTFPFTGDNEASVREAFLNQLKAEGEAANCLGLYTRLGKMYYLLKKKPNLNHGSHLLRWPKLLQKLDTVVLTSVLFQDVLGMTEADLDDASRIAYSSVAEDALGMVGEGGADLAAILNPTRIEQVRGVAEAGLIMPRKSTYFFPKVTTGLVFNSVNPFEEIEPAI